MEKLEEYLMEYLGNNNPVLLAYNEALKERDEQMIKMRLLTRDLGKEIKKINK